MKNLIMNVLQIGSNSGNCIILGIGLTFMSIYILFERISNVFKVKK